MAGKKTNKKSTGQTSKKKNIARKQTSNKQQEIITHTQIPVSQNLPTKPAVDQKVPKPNEESHKELNEESNIVINVKKLSPTPQHNYELHLDNSATHSTSIVTAEAVQKNVIPSKKQQSASYTTLPQPEVPEDPSARFAWVHAFTAELLKILKGGLYFGIGIISVVAVIIVLELYSNQRIFPETRAGTIELGYLSYENAKTKLSEELHDYFAKPITFYYKGKTIEITAEELGVRLALDQTLARLPIFEFEKQNPVQMLATLITDRDIGLDYTIDIDKATAALEAKFGLADQRAKNAKLSLTQEKKPQLVVETEQEGLMIDQQQLVEDLRHNIDHLSTDPLHLILIEEKPRITAQQVTEVKEKLEAKIKKPLTLEYEDIKLKISMLDHLDGVYFKEQNNIALPGSKDPMPIVLTDTNINNADNLAISSELMIGLDSKVLEPFFQEQLIKDIEKPTSPASIYRNEENQVIIEGKGENGKTVPVDKLVAAMELALNNEIETVPIPVVIEQAPLTISDDLKELGIRELLATGHSAYRGSPQNRMYNIDLGIKKYNGLLIAPGEEFSFNKYLGEVDGASGFKVEKVIKQNKIEYEYGGGICQVSTTLYRAALLAGLEITEQRPHSWVVSYYGQSMGHGLDATIYPGSVDLKFLNDTPGHILIQAYTDGAEAYFKLYGTSDGRTAELAGPYGGGLTYRWERFLTKNGQTTKEDLWSRYRPVPTTT